jgi:hypothetical protein
VAVIFGLTGPVAAGYEDGVSVGGVGGAEVAEADDMGYLGNDDWR